MEYYKKEDIHIDTKVVDWVNHFSRACWYDYNGKQKFEDLLWKHWIKSIEPALKEQSHQLFYDFQTNQFWNKEIWGEIQWYNKKDATCVYFDHKDKNIAIDIFCSEKDKYQFQVFEREKFKKEKTSGLEWIQNIPNLTTKGSRHESRLQSREDIMEILRILMI